jgi:hypothetical protein
MGKPTVEPIDLEICKKFCLQPFRTIHPRKLILFLPRQHRCFLHILSAHRWDVRASHLSLISSPTQLAHPHLSLPSPMFFHADLRPGRGEVELHRADLRPGKVEARGRVRWGWTAGGVRSWGTRWIRPLLLSRMSGGAAEPQPRPLLFLSSSVLQHKC